MVREVAAESAKGIVVVSWRSAEDGLRLKVRGEAEEVRLRCVCGRCHWIVRAEFSGGAPKLHITCHNCSRRCSFAMEGVSLPAR